MTADQIDDIFRNWFLAILLWWIFIGAVAAFVAPEDRRLTFFLITIFFLGPLGIGFAAVAQSRLVAPLTYVLDAATAPPPESPTSAEESPPSAPQPPSQKKPREAFTPGRWGLDWSNPFKQ
ncbi:hypothetical protein AU198_11650 [Mycobacterium sp. GA-1199]|uniref:hypothetical protein n=1 Tax=Mycobacterium sp. GA-1199 TaxID=1772287 RepID=UPI0007475D93|nr:hypothetical protein [Mycobacterium sp. GA-1199]KUI41812.1 hypothetical protein AU198_11650 [Mycobacterium sp. GA-1199]